MKTKPKVTKAVVVKTPTKEIAVQQDNSIDSLIIRAVDGKAALEQVDRLIDMKFKVEREEARKAFFRALAEFQSIAPDLQKNKKVSFDHKKKEGQTVADKTEYKYQELGNIAKNIREPLATCGLSYWWEQQEDDKGKITVVCVLAHRDGHQQKGEPLSGAADVSGYKNNIQQKASTITYLRRYTLTGILGLSSSDEDNDGKGGASFTEFEQVDQDALPPLPTQQFTDALKAINSGLWTLEYVMSEYTLTESQRRNLEIAEKNFKASRA